MNKYFEEIPLAKWSPEKAPKNDDFYFQKDNFSLKIEEEKYIISYISGELAGRLKKAEISKDDFFNIIDNKITFDEICIKYDIY